MVKILSALILFLLSYNIGYALSGDKTPPAFMSSTYTTKDIVEVENALSKITTFTADFEQITDNREVASGKFYLWRPNKIRWEYNSPTPILIIGQGSLVAYYNQELDEVSYVNLEDALAGFLTKDKINLQDGVNILQYSKNNVTLSVTFEQKKKSSKERITLLFRREDMLLVGLQILDNVNRKISVSFSNIKQGESLDKDLFRYPRAKRRNKTRI